MKLFKFIIWFFLVMLLSGPIYICSSDPLDENLTAAYASIRPMDVYDYCKTISADEFAGRLTGHEGYTAAAKWAADKFRSWGLLPISSREGYLQAYPSPYTIIKSANMELFLPGEKTGTQLRVGSEFLPLFYSAKGEARAGLVFVGWGICAPDLGYDDYAGMEVKDKFVLCFRGTPDAANDAYTEYDQHRTRMLAAKNKGALGLFYIYPEPVANPNGDWLEGFMPAIISDATAGKLLKEKETNVEKLKDELLSSKKPASFYLNSEMRFRVDSEHFPAGVGYNVVGYVAGSDPLLKKEFLVIGGHFDHCGAHLGFIFPGANDNASGSAVVMEIAAAFSRLEKKPKRSVIFVLFGGEEMGLTGSHYFADNLPAEVEKIDAMFNFDMVGEGDGTVCGISQNPPEFKETLDKADQHIHTLKGSRIIKQVGVRSSDYAPFFLKGASCISFFSNGPHLHYHLVGDTIYRINPEIMANVSKLAFLTGFNWANR